MLTNVLVIGLILVASAAGNGKGGDHCSHHYPTCPPGYSTPRICAQWCHSDADCSYGEFCCRTGCLIRCLPRPKEGQCPADNNGYCENNECSNDYDCPGSKKCCGSDYCKTCQEPEKPGSCPNRYDLSIGPCYAECSKDTDCPGKEKCCGSCPRVCEKPCKNK